MLAAALLLIPSALAAAPLHGGPWGPREPRASEGAAFVSGSARFTLLTDRLVRVEWDDAAAFEDRATVAFINRALPVPNVTASTLKAGTAAHARATKAHAAARGAGCAPPPNDVLAITGDALEILYNVGEPLSACTLSARGLDAASAFEHWAFSPDANPGDGNLLGTIRTLDGESVVPLNCTRVRLELNDTCGWDQGDCACEWGLVSRGGWAWVDDGANWALDDDTDFWAGPNADATDGYLFAHGRDYRGALADFALVAGRAALPPRPSLGVWWTRWFDFDQGDVARALDAFASRALPMDVFVFDMNWHTKDGWTGYSWDERLYPDPAAMLGEMHDLGLLAAANLHDADGVNAWEDAYAPACAALGLDPAAGAPVAFNVSDAAALAALEDVVLAPLEDARLGGAKSARRDGLDFWWIDWQQGEDGYGAAGGKMNPTIWTAHTRATDPHRRGADARGMVLARWGGLGAHRYPVGFSGDVAGGDDGGLNWENFAFQPYFSLTAANVGFGWSHDIVGPASDPELYARWAQWGAHSHVLRLHDRGGSAGACADDGPPRTCWLDEPWVVATPYFEATRAALRARAALLPYLYTAQRAGYDSGVSLLHPMYYDWPEDDGAYRAAPNGSFAQ